MAKSATILIKKTDGSTERVSFEEFKKRKFTQGESDLVGEKEDDLMVLPETHLTNTTPVKEVFENEAEADLKLHDDYHKSLLEEDFSEIDNLKNKRNDTETQDFVSLQQNIAPQQAPQYQSEFQKNLKNEKLAKDKNELIGENKNKFNNFIEAEQKKAEKEVLQNIKQKVNDIEAPDLEKNNRTLGPVEEILNFELKDYLRLSNDPNRASEMLLLKFENIKKESYLLFINFLKAWKKSPLYKLYLETILNALKENKNIEDYCAQNKELEYNIFKSLVDLNKNIKI